MAKPTAALATQRPEIRDGLQQFDFDRSGFIGGRVLPVLEAESQAGSFSIIPLAQLLQRRKVTRNDRGGYSRSDWHGSTLTYETAEYGFEVPVDHREAAKYAELWDAEDISAEMALDVLLREYEIRAAAAVFNATTWTGASLTTSVGTEWSSASSTPIANVKAAIEKVKNGTGVMPNALIINDFVFRNLQNVTEIKDAITASGAGQAAKQSDIGPAQLAQVFNLREVIVADAMYNTAAEGAAASLSPIWSSEYAMVARIAAPNSTLMKPAIGRTIHWAGDGSRFDGMTETYGDPQTRKTIMRARHDVQEKIVYAACGHLLSNITA